jgi:hypothetical protein
MTMVQFVLVSVATVPRLVEDPLRRTNVVACVEMLFEIRHK